MTTNYTLPASNPHQPAGACAPLGAPAVTFPQATREGIQHPSATPHDVVFALKQLGPKQVRYIKLGPGGIWAKDAIRDGTLPFGYRPVAHDACIAGDWETVRRQLSEMGRSPGASVTQGLREIREFYEHPADMLWVTMAHGHFWWAFAAETVFVNATATDGEPPRYRQTWSGWSKETLNGPPLAISSLSSALTKTASYQMTICEIDHADYLLRRLRGDQDPVQTAATAVQNEISRIALQMIDRLDWRDFETLIELIFTRGG